MQSVHDLGAKGLKESRITIKGDGDQDLVASGEVRQGPSYSPDRLISQRATLKEWYVQGCKKTKYKIYSPLDDRLVILTTSKAFDYCRARRDEIRFAFDP